MSFCKFSAQKLLAIIIFLIILSNTDLFSQEFQRWNKLCIYLILLFSSVFIVINGRVRISLMSIILLLWFFTFLISGVMSEYIAHGLWITINTAAVTILIYLLLAQISNCEFDEQLYIVWTSILLIVIIPSLLLFIFPIKMTGGVGLQAIVGSNGGDLLRYKGVFSNQNSLAIFLAIYISVSIYFFTKNRLSILMMGATIVATIFLIATISRAGIGFLIVFVLSYIFLTFKLKRSLYLLCFIFVLGGGRTSL